MPQLTGPLSPEGAVTDVEIGLGRSEIKKLRQAARPIPQPRRLRALLDSGAETTCLGPPIIKMLGLPWSGPKPVNMPGGVGLTLTSLYRADVEIIHSSGDSRHNFAVSDVAVCELPLSLLGYEALIGRDILDLLRFTYDGPARHSRSNGVDCLAFTGMIEGSPCSANSKVARQTHPKSWALPHPGGNYLAAGRVQL